MVFLPLGRLGCFVVSSTALEVSESLSAPLVLVLTGAVCWFTGEVSLFSASVNFVELSVSSSDLSNVTVDV